MVAKSLWENSRAMNPPVVVPEEAGAACQPGVVVAVVTVVYCPAGDEVAVPAGALIGCPAGAGDPVWADMKVPFWEYALLAMMIDINKVNMRSFFMDIPLLLEINIKGHSPLQIFRVINIHIVFNANGA
jgi:hypothetical protein